MPVPLLDLKAQYQSIKSEIDAVVAEVFESQYFIMGPKVEECEEKIAAYCDTEHAVGVSSGTDALLLAMMAEDIGPGHEVITSPYTFFATGGCVARLGAKPVFVDIDPESYNLDPSQIEDAISPRTRAIIPVHLYGQLADMDPILAIARRNELVVIEDAAQAIGAERDGKRAGSLGDYGCFSFFPSKNLGAAGDGGAITTRDATKAERLRVLRNHGAEPKYFHRFVGGNFRLDALQAAVVTVKLRHLDAWTRGRQANAERYQRLFQKRDLVGDGVERGVKLPSVLPGRHIFNQFVIRVPRRDAAREHLQRAGIGNEVYYPVPLHLQECFEGLHGRRGDHPHAEAAAKQTLAIPIYPELSDEQAEEVVEALATYLNDDRCRT